MKVVVVFLATLLLPGLSSAQSLPNYVTKFAATFQQVLDDGCEGSPPLLHVACQGDIVVTGTSNATIQCAGAVQQDESGFSYVECTTNACQDNDECASIWLQSSGGSVREGPFGEIFFECYGNAIQDIDAYMSFEKNGDGSCLTGPGRNVYVGRLGVQCGGAAYDFDDFYFECDANGLTLPSADVFGDTHSCFDGFVCYDFFGCPGSYEFERFEIKADHFHFEDACIETNNGSTIPDAVPANTGSPGGADLETEFRASWALIATGDIDACTVSGQAIEIECTTGPIEFISSSDSLVGCSTRGSSVLECNGRDPSGFSSVNFRCIGLDGRTPETESTYLGEDIACLDSQVTATVYHAIQLGIRCSTSFLVGDYFLECGAKSHQVGELDRFGRAGIRWTCAESVSYPSSSNVQTLLDVSITTDMDWRTDPWQECVDDFTPVALPTASPVALPVPTDTAEAEKSSSSGPEAGTIAGAVIGSLVFVVAAFALVAFLKKQGVNRSQTNGVMDVGKEQDVTYNEEPHDKNLELSVLSATKA